MDSNEPARETVFWGVGEDDTKDIVGYNVVIAEEGYPIEQVTSRKRMDAGRGEESKNSTPSVQSNERLLDKADELLDKGVAEATNGHSKVLNDDSDCDPICPDECDETFCLDELTQSGSRQEFTSYENNGSDAGGSNGAEMLGDVLFDISMHHSEEDKVGVSRTWIQMEAGRELCNDGFDEYCDSGLPTGWQNKGAEIWHKWDQQINDVGTTDIVDDVYPFEQPPETTTRGTSVTIGVDYGDRPNAGAGIGWSTSITRPSVTMENATTTQSGVGNHVWSMNHGSAAAEKVSSTESVCLAVYDKECDNVGGESTVQCEIDVDLEWGVGWDNMWFSTRDHTETFTAYTNCTDNPDCPECCNDHDCPPGERCCSGVCIDTNGWPCPNGPQYQN